MKEGWTYKKLGEVCNLIGGGTPSKKNASYYNGSILWATVRDMNCDVLTSTEYSITEEGLNDSASHIVDKGEIIIATRVGLGKVCKLAQPTAINQDLKGVVPKKENINRDFLFYYFKTIAKYIESNGVGATVKGVKMKFIEELDFPIPPLSEQQRIVARLDAAFAHIDELKANAEKQVNEARALFQKALSKAMEPKEGWKEKTLKEIGLTQTGTTPSKNDESNYGDYMPFIRPAELDYDGLGGVNYDSEISLSKKGVEKSRLIKENSILMCCIGSVGKMGFSKRDVTCNQQINTITPTPDYSPRFVYYAMLDNRFIDAVIKEAKSAQATLPIISKGKWEKHKLIIPPLSEQQRIVERLDSLSKNVKALEENQQKVVAECDALKQALLRKVFE